MPIVIPHDLSSIGSNDPVSPVIILGLTVGQNSQWKVILCPFSRSMKCHLEYTLIRKMECFMLNRHYI